MGCKLSLAFSFFLVVSLVFSGYQIREVKAASNTWQVGTSTDDAGVYETETGHPPWTNIYALDSATCRVGHYAPATFFGIGCRFTNVAIPKGATISSAYFKLYPDATAGVRSGTNDCKLDGEDADDAATFSTLADFNGRSRTSVSVDWIFDHSATTWAVSGDIKTVIQKIVDRDGWLSGNDLVIFCGDKDGSSTSADDVSESYDGSPSYAPKLEVTWMEEGQDLTFSLFENFNVWDSSSKAIETSNAFFQNFNAYSSIAFNKEIGFKLYEPFNLWSYLASSKEQAFTFFQPFNLWSSMEHTIETAYQDLYFTLFESTTIWSSLSTAKEQAFSLSENFNLWSSLTMATEGVALDLYFTFFEAFNPFASIGTVISEELTLNDVYGLAALGFILAIVGICLAVAFKKK